MMRKALYVAIPIILIFGVAGIYLYLALQKIQYSYTIDSYVPTKIDLKNGQAIIDIGLTITIKSPLFFTVPVSFLYYEVYYKDNLLGKSNAATAFYINKSPMDTILKQSIDIYLDKTNIEIASNYISKTPTTFAVRVIMNMFGFTIDLKKINFTY